MTSISWFSGFQRRYQFLRPRQHIEERLTLIIDFCIFYSGFLAAKRLISEPIEVSTDVTDKHARYISKLLLSPAKSKVTNELGGNSASFASITVFVNAPPLYLPRRYAIANARIAPMPCSFAARMAANRSCFLASSCLTPIRICSI